MFKERNMNVKEYIYFFLRVDMCFLCVDIEKNYIQHI